MVALETNTPDTLTDDVLLGMIPKAGTLVPWNGERHLIYLRDSAPHLAEGSGPPVQLRQCLERKQALGDTSGPLVLLEVQTATEDFTYRPVLAYVRQLIAEGKVDAVWCQCTSRMSRKSVDHIILDRLANANGVRLLYAWHEELDKLDGLMKELILYVLGVVDQLEAAGNRLKMYEGRKFKWAQGRLMGNSPAPYGHMYVDAEGPGRTKKGRLVPDPATCPRVVGWYHRIFDAIKCLDEPVDVSLRQIARELTEQGIEPPFTGKRKHPGEWHGASIRSIILNEVNIGIVRVGKTRTERKEVFNKKTNQWERKPVKTNLPEEEQKVLEGVAQPLPGLTPEMFYAVSSLIRDPRRAPRKLANPDDYPLRGKVLCECGHYMTPSNKKKHVRADGSALWTHTYRCTAYGSNESCQFTMAASKLHGPVWQAVRRFIDDKENLEKLILSHEKTDLSPVAGEIQIVGDLIAEKRQDIDDWTDIVKSMRGRSREKLLADISQAEDQLGELEQRLLRLQGRKQALIAVDQQVLGLKDRLSSLREILHLVEKGDDRGRINDAEFRRLQRAFYKALDIQVKVFYYPEEMSLGERQCAPARFTISSILGPMLSTISGGVSASQGRISGSDPHTL